MMRIGDYAVTGQQECCGCGTCALICPGKAIVMQPGELGCLYPVVNSEKCMQCGGCVQICAYQTQNLKKQQPIHAYAAAAVNADLLRKSASGGVFSVVAEHILESGGIVFGCSLEKTENGLEPMHICVASMDGLTKLQGSKYVQSNLGDTFVQIRDALREGKTVLFSGTPCQVDSLKHYLEKEDTSLLYTIDLVCHGVPSAKFFRDYLSSVKKDINSFSFRDKSRGWGLNAVYTYRCGSKERKVLLSPELSSYYSYFLESETYRESCYSCRYANVNRIGDLTLGDYWGFETVHPELLQENGGPYCLKNGVSALLVNTDKGQELLRSCCRNLTLSETDVDTVVRWNRQLTEPSTHTEKRNALILCYSEQGYSGVETYWRKSLGLRYGVRTVRSFLKAVCRRA